MRMVIMSHILIALGLNIFKKKLKNSYEMKMLPQIFIEYKHTIE